MKRIYHTWDKWECYPAGFYENDPPEGMTARQATEAYAVFLRDSERFGAALQRVITEWKNSCEHYLTNERMNRIAWLGQASMCIATGVPHTFRSGFNMLSESEKQRANELALRYLNQWLASRNEEPVDMAGAGVAAKVNLY